MKVCVGVAKPGAPPHLLHYTTNTMPGSSGSPVFTIDWRLVGLDRFSDSSLGQNGGSLMKSIIAEIRAAAPSALAGA